MSSLSQVFEASDEFSIGIAKAKLEVVGIASSVAGGDPYGSVQPGAFQLLVDRSDIDAASAALAGGIETTSTTRHRRSVRVAAWVFVAVSVGIPIVVHAIRLLS